MRNHVMLLGVLAVTFSGVVQSESQAIMFSDDFNRPDGPVGNGWTAWEAGTWLEGGQLRAGGTNNG